MDFYVPEAPDEVPPVTPTGDVRMVSGRTNLNGAVRRRIITEPGSLLHRPDYGAGAPGYIETQGSPTVRSKMANALRRNLLDDPRISDAKVTVSQGLPNDPAAAAVTLDLAIRVAKEDEADQLTLSITE